MIVGFLGSLMALVASLAYLIGARDPKYSVSQILLFGPRLFVSPEKYFLPGRHSTPWRALLLWLVSTVILLYVLRLL